MLGKHQNKKVRGYLNHYKSDSRVYHSRRHFRLHRRGSKEHQPLWGWRGETDPREVFICQDLEINQISAVNYPPTQVKIFDFKFFSVISVKNHFQPLVTETPPPPVTQTLVGRGRWKFFSLCKKSLLGTEQGWYGSSSVFRYTDCYYSLHFPNVAFHPQGHLTAHSNHWSTSRHVCIPERKLEERQKKQKRYIQNILRFLVIFLSSNLTQIILLREIKGPR